MKAARGRVFAAIIVAGMALAVGLVGVLIVTGVDGPIGVETARSARTDRESIVVRERKAGGVDNRRRQVPSGRTLRDTTQIMPIVPAPARGRIIVQVSANARSLSDAAVRVRSRGETIRRETNGDGQAVFDNLEPSDYTVGVQAESWSWVQIPSFILKGGETRNFNVVLEAGWRVVGRVAITREQCANGARDLPSNVRAKAIREFRRTGGALAVEIFQLDLETDGSFTATLPPGQYHFIAAGGLGDHKGTVGVEFELSQNMTDLCLMLTAPWEGPETEEELRQACNLDEEAASQLPQFPCRIPEDSDFVCSLVGRVTDPNGVPIGSMSVVAYGSVDECEADLYSRWIGLPPEKHWTRSTVTDSNGRFAFEQVLCTGYFVLADGMAGRYACGWQTVVLESATTTADISIIVEEVG